MEGGSSAPDSTEYSFAFGDITSPSQLQEVTLDQDASFANTMAIKSPNASLRGRSVKDIEEQLTTLRKENFNLKLRIYFLEEKMGSTGFTLDKDNVLKKNIDLQVQIATLQKELKEKHELLVEAVKAMELNDEEHKKYSQNKDEELAQVQQEIEDLRMQLHDAKLGSEGGMSEKSDMLGYYTNRNSSNEALLSKQEKMQYLNVEFQIEKDSNASIQLLMDQIEKLQRKCDQSEEEIQTKDEQIKVICDKNNVLNATVAELTIQLGDYKGKISKLKQENESLVKKVNDDDKRIEDMFEQYNELKRKYSLVKSSLEASERLKVAHEMKINKLEYETEKYRTRMKELQIKLEEAQNESKKNQNLAVSKSPDKKPTTSHTDDGFVSVSNPATPAGTPKKDALHVPVAVARSASLASIPSSPDKFISIEEMIRGSGENGARNNEKILSELQTLKIEHSYLKQKIVKLKSEQIKACEIIKSMIESRNKATEEINKLKKQNQELERELECVVSKPAKDKSEMVPLTKQIAELNITAVTTPAGNNNEKSIMAETQSDTAEIVEHYRALTSELEAKIEVLMATVEENDSQMHKIRNQYEELLKILQEKDNRIIDLEFELLSCNPDSGKITRFSIEGGEKQASYERVIEEKDKEIERLNCELKKCTCYLQEIVNKELWEKNREIEKLYKKNDGTSEITKLRKELSTKDMQLKVLKERICELGLDIPIPTNGTFNNLPAASPQEQSKIADIEKKILGERINQLEMQIADMNADSLKSENELLRAELVKCENLRKSSNEICNILGNRLEELATFLDSLLKQKSVLGFLGFSKNKKIREIIDNTLDLSRSFTMNMSINPDQSLTQLSNISALLNNSITNDLSLNEVNNDEEAHFSIIPANITLTYQSHLYKKDGDTPHHEQIITALREQIFNLKSELQLRDNQLNEMHQKEYTDKTTDTEEDKDVNDVKLFNATSTTLKALSEAHSESEGWSEPDRKVSRARIGLSQTAPILNKSSQHYCGDSTEEDSYNSLTLSPSKRRQTVIELQQHISELEEELKRKTVQLNSGDFSCARQNIEELESRLKQTEEKLEIAELRKVEIEKQLKQLQDVVDTLLSTKRELEISMVEKDKAAQNRINEIEMKKDEALVKVGEFEKEALDARNEVKVLEEKLQKMQSCMDNMELKLRKEYEECTVVKLKEIEEEFLSRIKIVEQKAQNEVTAAKEAMKMMEDEYVKHYIKKSDVERKLVEVETIREHLNNLKETVQSYEDTIESYKRKEQDIVHQLEEYQCKNNKLRKELDDVTLQYSEVVLEKTKIANEKALIEQELRKICEKEHDLKQNMNQIQCELNRMSESYQDQISNFQQQKSKLEVKVSELESANAELYNKLVRLQGNHCDLNSSMPNLVSRSVSMRSYKRQCSDQNYHSEDNMDVFRNLVYNNPTVRGAQDRQEVTSSPDLGIESDHGRFSSLETQPNLPRPIFQTVQLTESMKNLLDGENNQLESVSCGSEHCCQKSLEVIQENNELRRKLLRMKRALEETANQLNLANQRKKQVEKTICKQIHKTSQVLRKAKANLDSGSESDVFKM